MKQYFVLLFLCLASCVSDPMGLTVKQYHLRENMFDENNDLMVRGEVQRFLHGAVTQEERLQKVGQYYHLIWKQRADKARNVEFLFEYLQAGSGSSVKRMTQKGTVISQADAYFTITGHDYQKNGRVLAWRASVMREGKVIATKRSYLWR